MVDFVPSHDLSSGAHAMRFITELDVAFGARLWVMLIVFIISLFAVSFPTVSERVVALRIPPIVFFIGKHFGTGVILATAFVHLLQDAFTSLTSPVVNERWPIGRWTGLIVLTSLLVIFLIEYISTSYVDRLHAYSSLPPSPTHALPALPVDSEILAEVPEALPEVSEITPNGSSLSRDTSTTPLLARSPPSKPKPKPKSKSKSKSKSRAQSTYITYGSTRISSSRTPKERVTDNAFFAGGHHRHESREAHRSHHERSLGRRASVVFSEALAVARENEIGGEDMHEQTCTEGHDDHDHDVHGKGHMHTECVGIGHADGGPHGHVHVSIDEWDPAGAGTGDVEAGLGEDETDEDSEEIVVGRRRQIVGMLVLLMGMMIHSVVIGLTLSIVSRSEFTSLATAISFHQLFEGFSLGIRIAGLPSRSANDGRLSALLKPTLALAFAIATPLGLAAGLVTFGGAHRVGAQLQLVQGLMSAISAGMLIYAACVEMLAGDFVMDPLLWRSSVPRQALALGSLCAGIAAMAIVGLFD